MAFDNRFYTIFYISSFLVFVLFSIIINKLFLTFSKTLGIRELQRENKEIVRWASQTKPSLGGLAFYILFLFAIALEAIIHNSVDEGSFLTNEMIGILLSCTLGFFIGLADDAYNTNAILKFIGQFLCANILIVFNVSIEITPIAAVNYAFTTFWVIGIMNSINMLDNMDGISATIATTILTTILLLLFKTSGLVNSYTIIILSSIGALLGFLFFNWPPAKIYMGDTGSQFLGILLAGLSILFLWKFKTGNQFLQIKQFLIPMLIFIIPIIDTTTVFLRRMLKGNSPFIGGKDHLTHHLVYLGLSEKQTVLFLGSISALSIGISLALLFCFPIWEQAYSFYVLLYFATVFLIMQWLYNKGSKKLI